MKVLWMTVGLPRSGKSTSSKGMGFPVVSCDAIRQSLGCYPFTPVMEPYVWAIARTMVESLFNAGHSDVILDSCSQTRSRRNDWKSSKWQRKYVIVNTPPSICIQRAHATDQSYLVPIIEKMAAEYEDVSDDERDA